MIHNINRKKDRNHITSIAEKDKLKKKSMFSINTEK